MWKEQSNLIVESDYHTLIQNSKTKPKPLVQIEVHKTLQSHQTRCLINDAFPMAFGLFCITNYRRFSLH